MSNQISRAVVIMTARSLQWPLLLVLLFGFLHLAKPWNFEPWRVWKQRWGFGGRKNIFGALLRTINVCLISPSLASQKPAHPVDSWYLLRFWSRSPRQFSICPASCLQKRAQPRYFLLVFYSCTFLQSTTLLSHIKCSELQSKLSYLITCIHRTLLYLKC